MKLKLATLVMATLATFAHSAANAAEVKVYPQSFEAGGWGLDAQFMDVMGSPYLIAHGLGVRVLDAKARVEFPEAGEYRVWVRTKNWADGAPGRFRVLVNGKPLDKEFGAGPREWAWEDGGAVAVEKGEASVALNDLTGFDGRCAGIVFASGGEKPVGPLKVDEANVAETVNADFVVVGGGMPGTCAAVAAARRGLKVALVQDRPVLGGNASAEIRVYCAGEAKHPLVRELRNYFMNRDVNMPWCDERRMRIVEDEENIELRLLTRAFGVEKNVDGTIAAVKALDLKSNCVVRFEAPLFCDATGDGWVGFWAGADWRMGREAKSEFDESRAPETADGDTLGASIMWTSADANMAVPFSAPFAEPHAQGIVAVNGEWRWEYGIHRDMIAEGEEIRDRMLLAIYGAFSLAKKKPENANKVLNFCPYLIGKCESRRIMGDWILSQKDVAGRTPFEDSIATGTWGIDLHYDGYKPGVDFLSRNTFDNDGRFWIPYRSIYSRNVGNLFVVGRCFSCTHVGLGAPRVISTLSQLGVAAGEAAAMCRELGETPRGIYANGHVRRLQEILGGGFPGVPDRETAGWLIVDDESDGVKFGKGWRMFRNTNGGHVGLCSHSANAKGAKAEPATYPLPVAEAGRYALMGKGPYMWNAKPGSATAMEIVSGGKAVAFTADQAQSTGEWVKFGEFDLEPGATLTIIPAKSRGHVVADGFALVPATFAYSSSVALAKADCADLSSGAFAKAEAAMALKVEDLRRLKRELAVPCETNGWGKLFVRCQVNGVECRLLVDTGCTLTYFDMPFVERAFGRDAVRSVKDPRAAVSNIDSIRESGSALKLHGVSMSISGVEFGGLDVTVIDGDWDESDGMLGWDVLGSVPTLVSVGDRKLVFNLRERKGFKSYTAGRYVPGGEDICSFFGIVNGKPVSFALDTGGNTTLLMGGQGWQWKPGMKGESQVDNINGSRKVEMAWGMPTSVTACDVDISLKSPLVEFGDPKHQRINKIGVDTLKDYDILVWDRYYYSVRPRDAKQREDVSPVFLDLDFDTTAAPDLKEWTRRVLRGAGYIRNAVSAVAIDITSGWPVPRRVKAVYVDDDGAPPVRIADGTLADIYLNAKWFRENKDGEAAGAFFRALVQVMQGYGKTPGATEDNCPKWLAEGIAEYAKCYIFDRYSGKRDYSCDNIGACRYNDSCRATASFLNFLFRKYPGILARANAALRAHAFDNGTFWKEATGMTADELEKLWRVELAGGVATAAPAPMERKETE